MSTIDAHELARPRVLITIRREAIPTTTNSNLAELLQLDGLNPATLTDLSRAAGLPEEELWTEDALPKNENGEEKIASDTSGRRVDSERRRKDLRKGP